MLNFTESKLMKWYDITIIYGTKKKLRTFETTLRARDTVNAIQKGLNDLYIEKRVSFPWVKQTLITSIE